MAKRRLPADVIELYGNRSHLSKAELEERRADEVKATPISATRPPAELTDPVARACWVAHAPELDRLGLFSGLDVGSFRLLCETYALAVYSLREMLPKRKDGEPDGRRRGYATTTIDTAHGSAIRKHPALSSFNMLVNTYRSLCSDFGLTPLSRVQLRPAHGSRPADERDHDDDDAFDFGT